MSKRVFLCITIFLSSNTMNKRIRRKNLDEWENTYLNAIEYKRNSQIDKAKKLLKLISNQKHYLSTPSKLSLADIYLNSNDLTNAQILLNGLVKNGEIAQQLEMKHKTITKKGLQELEQRIVLQHAIALIEKNNTKSAKPLLEKLIKSDCHPDLKNQAMFHYNITFQPIVAPPKTKKTKSLNLLKPEPKKEKTESLNLLESSSE